MPWCGGVWQRSSPCVGGAGTQHNYLPHLCNVFWWQPMGVHDASDQLGGNRATVLPPLGLGIQRSCGVACWRSRGVHPQQDTSRCVRGALPGLLGAGCPIMELLKAGLLAEGVRIDFDVGGVFNRR